MSNNKFNRQRKQDSFKKEEPGVSGDTDYKPTEDPRVRAFVRDYAPIVNQDDPFRDGFGL